MRLGQSSPPNRPRPSDRAADGRVQLPGGAEQPKPRTPLGICHVCAAIIRSGDSLAIAGGHLLHAECPTGAEPPA
jgi:hypothetical protein